MGKKTIARWGIICVLVVSCCMCGEYARAQTSDDSVEIARSGEEFSAVRIEPAQMNGQKGIAVIFDGTDDLHYYAKQETAPAGYNLKLAADSEDLSFGEAIFPKWESFLDPLDNNVEVYVGKFTVFIPVESAPAGQVVPTDVSDIAIKISAIACTSKICLQPFEKTLQTRINWSQADSWQKISFEIAKDTSQAVIAPSYSVSFALGLALLAGLALNIMPCVWPVLPIIVMRIVEQAKQSKGKSIAMGLAFCLGILLFFACLAGANIILRVFSDTVLQWGDQFRNPAFVAGMAILLVVLALFMFGVFTITVPSAIAGKSGSGKGYSGAVGMGFLAAILSTPCSFAILAAVFAWAQAKPLPLATLTIMVMGVGMALPYGILTSMPALLGRLPKPGRWMELFKQSTGFILLGIAVWFISVLETKLAFNVLGFAVVLGFCIWMWSSWVRFDAKLAKKLQVRVIALVLIVLAVWVFLVPKEEIIDWQGYDSELIETSLEKQRPVLIKFTAGWCASCVAVDIAVYSRKDIAGLIDQKNVLAIKADTTTNDYPATLALKNKYNEPGVPVSILYLPGKEDSVRWRDKFFADELKTLLEELPDKQ